MTKLRITLSVVVSLVGVLMLAVTLTVPAFEATAPAILTVALAVLAFFLWPRGRKARRAEVS